MSDEEEYGLGGKLDFLGAFAALPDPRQSLKVLYPLDEVLLLTLCAVVCGADGWVSVALFGKRKLDFLRQVTEADAVFFAGDDVTDEDGFLALEAGDVGLKIGSGETAASFRVEGPEDVADVVALLARLRSELPAQRTP